TPQGTQAPGDDGTLRQGAEDEPRSLEGFADRSEAGQRPRPDSKRSDGNSPEGTGGSFALRVSSERARDSYPRRSHAVPPQSHVPRLNRSRRQPTLFDSFLTGRPEPDPATDFSQPASGEAANTSESPPTGPGQPFPVVTIAGGEKTKARDI